MEGRLQELGGDSRSLRDVMKREVRARSPGAADAPFASYPTLPATIFGAMLKRKLADNQTLSRLLQSGILV